MDWKALALWLADCQAATAEYDGTLKSTSKSRRRRLQSRRDRWIGDGRVLGRGCDWGAAG